MAHARRGDAHEHLVRLRLVELDLLDDERACRGSCRTAARIRISRPASARARRGRARRRGPGPAGGAIVPSAAISSGAGSSQSRRSADQAGGSNGTSTNGHGREGERRVEVRDAARGRSTRCAATRPGRAGRRARRAAGTPPMPPTKRTSRLEHVDPPRTTRSRASLRVRTISPAASRRPVSAAQRA